MDLEGGVVGLRHSFKSSSGQFPVWNHNSLFQVECLRLALKCKCVLDGIFGFWNGMEWMMESLEGNSLAHQLAAVRRGAYARETLAGAARWKSCRTG